MSIVPDDPASGKSSIHDHVPRNDTGATTPIPFPPPAWQQAMQAADRAVLTAPDGFGALARLLVRQHEELLASLCVLGQEIERRLTQIQQELPDGE